jgi:hypothetical protein
MYIRAYSSPFSWMFIDLETALYFIENRFEGFTDAVKKGGDTAFFHRYFANDEADDRICKWTHHDMSNNDTKTAMQRRGERLIEDIYSPHTLLVYYDFRYRSIEYYTDLLLPFTGKYGCKVLVIAQPENKTAPLDILFKSEELCLVSLGRQGNLQAVLKYLYSFKILPKKTTITEPENILPIVNPNIILS